jgi:non-ribosomal peptide synthetase component F
VYWSNPCLEAVPASDLRSCLPVVDQPQRTFRFCASVAAHSLRPARRDSGVLIPAVARPSGRRGYSFSGRGAHPRPATSLCSNPMMFRPRRPEKAVTRQLGTGLIPHMRLDRHIRARSVTRHWGLTPPAAYGLWAIRYPNEVAIIDDSGSVTFSDVDRRTNALARSLQALGLVADTTVGLMCRNHRGLIEATVACAKVGADVVYLDPDELPSVIAETVWRRPVQALIHDADCTERLRAVAPGTLRVVAWSGPGRDPACSTLDELIAASSELPLQRASTPSSVIVRCERTARTTDQELPCSLITPSAAQARPPLPRRGLLLIAAPITGRWGFLHLTLGLRSASTLVLTRRSDPEAVLSKVEEHRVSAVAVLPEMLEQIVSLPPDATRRHNTDSLTAISLPGPFLDSDVALPAIARFGEILYNLRGRIVISLGHEWWLPAGARSRTDEPVHDFA